MAGRGCLSLLLKGLWQHWLMPPSWLAFPSTWYLSVCLSARSRGGGGAVCKFTLGEVARRSCSLSTCPPQNFLSPHCAPGLGCRTDEGQRLPKDGEPNAELGKKGKAKVGGWFLVWAWSQADLRSLGCRMGMITARCKGLARFLAPARGLSSVGFSSLGG